MNDQEILSESDNRSSVEGYLNYRLSDLNLDTISMASSTEAVSDRAAGVDNSDSYQMEFSEPSPPRYRNKTSLKRRSPSSAYSPPRKSGGFHRLISEGYQILNLPSADSVQKDSNQTKRSLFPPPLPLGRTSSDPVRLSSIARTDQNSPRQISRTASDPTRINKSIYEGFDSTQESPSIKKLKRVDSAKKFQQQMDEIKDWIGKVVEEDIINLPETVVPAEAPLQEEVQEKEIEEEDDLEEEADTVKAKRVGEGTMLEFKCKCGSGYSVGIFGNSCFYKLL